MQTPDEKDIRIDAQAQKIKELRDENQLLKDEKHDLTMSLNDVSRSVSELRERNEFLEGEIRYFKHKSSAEVWF